MFETNKTTTTVPKPAITTPFTPGVCSFTGLTTTGREVVEIHEGDRVLAQILVDPFCDKVGKEYLPTKAAEGKKVNGACVAYRLDGSSLDKHAHGIIVRTINRRTMITNGTFRGIC